MLFSDTLFSSDLKKKQLNVHSALLPLAAMAPAVLLTLDSLAVLPRLAATENTLLLTLRL